MECHFHFIHHFYREGESETLQGGIMLIHPVFVPLIPPTLRAGGSLRAWLGLHSFGRMEVFRLASTSCGIDVGAVACESLAGSQNSNGKQSIEQNAHPTHKRRETLRTQSQKAMFPGTAMTNSGLIRETSLEQGETDPGFKTFCIGNRGGPGGSLALRIRDPSSSSSSSTSLAPPCTQGGGSAQGRR